MAGSRVGGELPRRGSRRMPVWRERGVGALPRHRDAVHVEELLYRLEVVAKGDWVEVAGAVPRELSPLPQLGPRGLAVGRASTPASPARLYEPGHPLLNRPLQDLFQEPADDLPERPRVLLPRLGRAHPLREELERGGASSDRAISPLLGLAPFFALQVCASCLNKVDRMERAHLVGKNFSSAAPRSRGGSVRLRSRQAGGDLGTGARMSEMAAATGTVLPE